MQKFLLPLAIFFGFNLNAQHFCRTTEAQNDWFSKHPELRATFENHRQDVANLDKEMAKTGYKSFNRNSSPASYTVPVVFHILHVGTGECISDAQVIDAVNILTRDYNCQNTDTNNVVAPFKNLIGNTRFNFVLATKDPNGNCTNGIIRHWDTNTDWSGNLGDYAYTWPPTRYLNIYVVRSMGGGAAGYTYLPGSGIPSAMDAIVILSSYVGSMGSGNVFTSRALTHEVGHWFDLEHVWGYTNQPGVACGDDGVSDTPITKGYTSCNLNNTHLCNTGIAENVQNYMEYAYCQKMFTVGQSARMTNAINSTVNGRNNLSTNGNLAATGVTSPGTNCMPQMDITASLYTVCSGRPLSVKSFTFNAAVTSYSWAASGSAVILNPSSATTSVVFNTPGQTTVSCTAANTNGSVTKTLSILVLNGTAQINSSSSESFEGQNLTPPSAWNIISPTSPNYKWTMVAGISAQGWNSIYVPGENLPPDAEVILESPSYDFKHNPGVMFTFKYAYAWQSSLNGDVFRVQASRDCGGTWENVWSPSDGYLASGSGGIDNNLYSLPVGSEWKLYNVTNGPYFTSFLNEPNVKFRFYFQEDVNGTGFGNRFYLDDVHFTTPLQVGVNELTRAIGLDVYPNPSSSVFNVSFTLSDAAKVSYQIVSVTGQVMISETPAFIQEGSHIIRINENNSLASGIYFINFELNGTKVSRKLIVE
jgi:hypothetical protein